MARKELQMATSDRTPPAAKRARTDGDAPTAPTEAIPRRRNNRVTLEVGGETFTTTRDTLTRGSDYFEGLLVGDDDDAEVFVDRDADLFRVLLSCMRQRSSAALPREETICARLLLEADFFGMAWLIDEVVSTAMRHSHAYDAEREKACDEESDDESDDGFAKSAAQQFAAKFGSVVDAVRTGVLPSLFFRSDATPPVTTFVPAATRAELHVHLPNGNDYRLPVQALAVVERAGQPNTIEAVVPRLSCDLDKREYRRKGDFVLASQMMAELKAEGCEDVSYTMRTCGELIALPPGSMVAQCAARRRALVCRSAKLGPCRKRFRVSRKMAMVGPSRR